MTNAGVDGNVFCVLAGKVFFLMVRKGFVFFVVDVGKELLKEGLVGFVVVYLLCHVC